MDGNLSVVRCSKTPDAVIREVLNRVEKDSDGYCIGKIEPCYYKNPGILYKHDVFISIKDCPTYKYRLMFVKCTKGTYPVMALMTANIEEESDDIDYIWDGLYTINSENMLRHFMNTILGSTSIKNLYKEIINEKKKCELLKQEI